VAYIEVLVDRGHAQSSRRYNPVKQQTGPAYDKKSQKDLQSGLSRVQTTANNFEHSARPASPPPLTSRRLAQR